MKNKESLRTKKPRNDDSPAPRRPKLSRRKKLAFSLITVVFVLALLESVLALVGVKPELYESDPYVGFSSYVPLYVQDKAADGTAQYVTAENKLRLFNRQSFPQIKPQGSFRIFSVGGSTTHGRPYDDATSFSGWLREYLKVSCPEETWEVINAGGVSYASYRVALLMEELVGYEPDLFIIYTGHNEFLEERTYGDMKETSVTFQRLSTLAAKTRTGTLLGHAFRGVAAWFSSPASSRKTVLESEVVTRSDNVVGPMAYTRDDELKEKVFKHFSYNLNRMIAIADSVGAKVIFVTPASSLRGMAPFKNEHRSGMTPSELSRWQQQFQLGRQKFLQSGRLTHQAAAAPKQSPMDVEKLRRGLVTEALAAFDEAVKLDDRYANLHFLRGHALWQLERHDEAKVALLRALEEDVCPLRALSPMVKIVEDVAAKHEIPLIDFVAMQEKHSPHGVGGNEVFVDHVHPRIEAHGRLALEILNVMAREGMAKPAIDDNTMSLVASEVKGRIDNKARAKALMNLSKVIGWAGKLREAHGLAVKAVGMDPNSVAVQYQAGLTSQLIGHRDEAIAYYQKAVEIEPAAANVHGNLGIALEQRGDLEAAIRHFQLALKHGHEKDAERYRRNLKRAQDKLQKNSPPDARCAVVRDWP